MGKTIFFFSHIPQITWYSVMAQGFRDYFKDCRIVLFVHGKAERKLALQYKEYDEVFDLIEGFQYKAAITLSQISFSENVIQLEKDLMLSFFWEDAKVDRWVRAKNNPAFVAQYLNHAFDVLYEKYNSYQPVCAFGESTMAIYRYAHRLFDRDKKPYLAPMSTRYFDRFYLEDNWYWCWEEAIKYYHEYIENGIPEDVLKQVLPVYENIAVNSRKPIAFENFTKTNTKGYKDFKWFDFQKVWTILQNIGAVDKDEVNNNIRNSVLETSVIQKLKRYFGFKKNYKAYLELVEKEVPKNISICTYFLHFQPEYTVDSLGKFYIDQNFLIANIASSLPAGHYLVVKDHITMVGLRPRAFYEHIKANSNVILLHHSVDSISLIKQSKMVFTIVGTSALEAMFLGVPSIMFGKYAFDTTNLISLCTDIWELGDLIRKKMAETHTPHEVKKHALALLAGKYMGSDPGKIVIAENTKDEFLKDKERNAQVRKMMGRYLTKKSL